MDLIEISRWIEARARAVLKALIVEDGLSVSDASTIIPDDDWKEVSRLLMSRR